MDKLNFPPKLHESSEGLFSTTNANANFLSHEIF